MKQKIKKISCLVLILSLCSALLFVPKAKASSISVILGIPGVKQAKSNWCWAASAEMAGKFYSPSSLTQYDIVKKIYGTIFDSYPDTVGTLQDAANGSTYETNVGKAYYYSWTNVFTFSQIITQIDSRRQPIEASVGYYVNGVRKGGHMVVIKGYDSSTTLIDYIDPITGSSSWMDYSTFYNGGVNGGIFDGEVWTY